MATFLALVVFQKWRWPHFPCPSKGIPVHKPAHDHGGQRWGLRPADALTHQACDARPYGARRALDGLGGGGAGRRRCRGEGTRGGAPRLWRGVRQPAGLPPRVEPETDGLCATTTDRRADGSRGLGPGLPHPAWGACGAATSPPRSPRRGAGALTGYGPLLRGQGAPPRGLPRLQHGGVRRECTPHRVGTAVQRSRRSAPPAGLETPRAERGLACRPAPAVARVEPATACATEGGLTEGARGAPGRWAACAAWVTLTVRTADGDERHGPFLPKGGDEDEAQCDIHLSPSPLLKHYLTQIVWPLSHRCASCSKSSFYRLVELHCRW